jgi:hypothetical protein
MGPDARRQYLRRVAQRYAQARSKKERKKLIDEVCENIRYHRKHVIRLMHNPPRAQGKRFRRRRIKTYGAAVERALLAIWDAADYACAKLVHPQIKEWTTNLERLGHLHMDRQTRMLVLRVSRGTMERIYALNRHKRPLGRYERRRHARATLARSIPIEMLPEPAVKLGYIDADAVQHDGGDPSGTFVRTVVFKDRCTYWESFQAVWGKHQGPMRESVRAAQKAMPFPWRQLHFDSGGEFINRLVVGMCRGKGIACTRSRPYRSNDNARVENTNRYAVRRLLGRTRFDDPRLMPHLRELYRLQELYRNFFHATKKLVHTTTVKIDGCIHRIKKYDTPATPYARLLAHEDMPTTDKRRLTRIYHTLDPVGLLAAIRQKQRLLIG